MNKTKIEWADVTWNPIRGCSRISEGCRNCYAERMAARQLPGMNSPIDSQPYARMTKSGPRWTGKVELIEDKLTEPLRWKKSRRVFVNSMSDLFHESVKEEWLYRIMAVIAAAPQHTFMVMTKRANVMRDRIAGSCATAWPEKPAWPLPNLWLGISAENQEEADRRIPDLMATPAAVRFVSCEPLLGPIDLKLRKPSTWAETCSQHREKSKIDWVIVGGESGPGARPMHPDWARKLRDQCQRAQVPFFFKQWGEWLPFGQYGNDGDTPTAANTGAEWGIVDRAGNYFAWTTAWNGRTGLLSDLTEVYVYRVGKGNSGRFLDGAEWTQFPVTG